VLDLRTQFTIVSSFKVPTKEIGALYKSNIKSHIFIFDSALCQISLSLHHILFLDTQKVYNFFSFSKGTYQRKKVHFQKKYTITNFHFLQCALLDFLSFA